MPSLTVEISKDAIEHDGQSGYPEKNTALSNGIIQIIQYVLQQDALDAGYSFSTPPGAGPIDSSTIRVTKGSVSNPAALLSGVALSSSTAQVTVGAATDCQLDFCLRLNTPGGGTMDYDPLITIGLPK